MTQTQSRKDLLLMSYFRKNSRENLTRISRQTQIPVSTIFDKLRIFEKNLIRRYTALIDFKKVGFDIKIHMLFKLEKEKKEEFKNFLLKNFNVNSIFKVNNGFDFLIEGIFKDMDDLNKFIEQLDQFKIINRQELFILEDIKREAFLSDSLHADILYQDS